MSEAELQQRVCQMLAQKGWLVLESDKASMGQGKRKGAFGVGFPDLIVMRRRTCLLIELKTEKGDVRPDQTEMHAKLAHLHGIQVAVCRSEADVLAAVASASAIASGRL